MDPQLFDERMQTSDTNARLYSELISKREESESALRKDMFKSIIDSFLRTGQATPEQEVLNLELLVYNFHESLNLKPLFRHIQRTVADNPRRKEYLDRLNRVAGEVTKKQMLVISEGGTSFDATANTAWVHPWHPYKRFEMVADVEVEVIRLDTFLNQHGIGQVDRLEVDAQGEDLRVVESLGAHMDGVKKIQIEQDLLAKFEE